MNCNNSTRKTLCALVTSFGKTRIVSNTPQFVCKQLLSSRPFSTHPWLGADRPARIPSDPFPFGSTQEKSKSKGRKRPNNSSRVRPTQVQSDPFPLENKKEDPKPKNSKTPAELSKVRPARVPSDPFPFADAEKTSKSRNRKRPVKRAADRPARISVDTFLFEITNKASQTKNREHLAKSPAVRPTQAPSLPFPLENNKELLERGSRSGIVDRPAHIPSRSHSAENNEESLEQRSRARTLYTPARRLAPIPSKPFPLEKNKNILERWNIVRPADTPARRPAPILSDLFPFEDDNRPAKERIRQRPEWMIQKEALKAKLGGQAWDPRKKLSPDAMEGIRHLHASQPDKFTTPVLAENFKYHQTPSVAYSRVNGGLQKQESKIDIGDGRREARGYGQILSKWESSLRSNGGIWE